MNLHFATKLFTAVPNFLGQWMWVPAPYKQTKNQTNATTDITAGSCYREVRWNWKVSTNGQNPTFSHLSARSQLRKWQWSSSSRCVAGHRQGHPEKDPHFSKELAHGCWKLNNTLSPSLGLFTRESSLCDYTIHSSAKFSRSLNVGACALQANQKSNICDYWHYSWLML